MPTARPGRPRSETSRRSILVATGELLVEQGYDRLTLVDIAARAGVGKQTLYRWWPSKASLVADCVLENVVRFEPVVVAPETSALAAIRTWLDASRALLLQPDQAALFRGLSAAASTDESARAKLAERFTEPLIGGIDSALRNGIASGEIRMDVATEPLAELLIGAMMFTLMRGEPVGADWADGILDTITRGIAAAPAPAD